MSPFVDLALTGTSYVTNRDKDPFFTRDLVQGLVSGFLAGAADPRDPRVNPLYADLTGLGPLYIQAGGDETLLDDARLSTRSPGRPASTSGWTSSPACCTRSRWPRAGRRRPTTRSAGWPAGYGPGWACEHGAVSAGALAMGNGVTMTDRSAEFTERTEPFRRELLAHCYRMLGSADEAEDLVQETYLRAWRAYGGLRGPVLGARLALPHRHQRLPDRAGAARPAGAAVRPGRPGRRPRRAAGPAEPGVPWLEPIPDARVLPESADPAAIVTAREGLRLALIASLQYLPPRQRAVLLLREVLGFPAAEVADMLATSTVGGQEHAAAGPGPARGGLAGPGRRHRAHRPARPGAARQYIAGFEHADIAALEKALRADAAIEMVGTRTWFSGRATCLRYLAHVIGSPGDWLMTATVANGQPAAPPGTAAPPSGSPSSPSPAPASAGSPSSPATRAAARFARCRPVVRRPQLVRDPCSPS